jgi:hypothetical protein
LEKSTEWNEHSRDEFHKTLIAEEARELGTEMALDVAGVVGLEIPISSLMEEDQDGHDLTWAERGGALATALAGGELVSVPVGKKGDTEGVDGAEQFE